MRRSPDLTSADEAIVVALAKSGDRAAFRELVVRRQSWIRNLLRRLSGNTTLADDLAQQTFLNAWRGIGRLQADAAFGGWLRRMAINVWYDHLRRNDPLQATSASDEATLEVVEPVEPVEPVETPSLAEHVDLQRALAALAPKIRACIVLFYGEGLTHSEIAELTRFPLGTVKSYISRGLGQLRGILGTEGAAT
jgi:RNA polymerase sigma-70 factor, ECF subfamily